MAASVFRSASRWVCLALSSRVQQGVAVRGAATWTPFVGDIDYDAKGQREKIVYAGRATTTEYEYDDETFRLRMIHDSGAPETS